MKPIQNCDTDTSKIVESDLLFGDKKIYDNFRLTVEKKKNRLSMDLKNEWFTDFNRRFWCVGKICCTVSERAELTSCYSCWGFSKINLYFLNQIVRLYDSETKVQFSEWSRPVPMKVWAKSEQCQGHVYGVILLWISCPFCIHSSRTNR